MYKEKKGWKKPFKIITVTDKNVTVDSKIIKGIITFRSFYIKPYTQLKEKPIIIPDKKTEKIRINFLYVNIKKKNDKILAFKLKVNGKIIIPGKSFKAFNFKKLNALFKKGIFRPEIYDAVKY